MPNDNEASQTFASPDLNAPKFDASGKPISKAIADAEQALQIARKLRDDDRKRDYERARILAAFNGEAPYSEAELLAQAQGYRFNLSFGFMEGVIGRAAVPYNDLTNDTHFIANCQGDLPEGKMNIFREEFGNIIDKWGEWPKLKSRLIQDLLLYGFNNLIWPTDQDPWPLFVPQTQGFVHDMTANGVERLELFVWWKTYQVHELYEKIQDAESAQKAGWNLENVRAALEGAVPQDLLSRRQSGQLVKAEELIRAGTLYSTVVGGKVVEAFHVFAAELDGSVTHYIVKDTPGSGGDITKTELFKRENRFKSFKDMLVYFDLEPGDGKWHGSRGLGRRSFNTHRTIDKNRCNLLDQCFAAGMVIIQPTDQAGQEDFTLTVAGPFAVIPPGINVQATNIPTISNTSLQLDALLTATSEQRVGDVVPNSQSEMTGGDKTATQSKIDTARGSAISKSNLQRFLDPLSQTMSIIVRRLLNTTSQDGYAKELQQKLIERGFTPEDIKKISGARSTGRIEAVMGTDAGAMQQAFGEFRGDPDVPQRELKRRRLASLLGPKDAEALLPMGEDPTRQLEAVRQQKIEIGALLSGIPLEASPRDLHEFHLPTILQWLDGQVQQALQTGQGAHPDQLQEGLRHAGEHLGFLSSDKSQAKLFKQSSLDFKRVAQEVQKALQQAQIAQQKQAAMQGGPQAMQGAPQPMQPQIPQQ